MADLKTKAKVVVYSARFSSRRIEQWLNEYGIPRDAIFAGEVRMPKDALTVSYRNVPINHNPGMEEFCHALATVDDLLALGYGGPG